MKSDIMHKWWWKEKEVEKKKHFQKRPTEVDDRLQQ